MSTITHQELIQRIIEREKRGACFVSLLTETDPQMRKTNNPHVGVKKVTEINVTISHRYENCVNNQREREGGERDFEAKPRKWGVHYQGSRAIIEHKGQFYLSAMPNPSGHPKVRYVKDGAEVAKELLSAFLPASKTEETADAQGVERAVIHRDYAFSSIRKITMDGQTFDVIG